MDRFHAIQRYQHPALGEIELNILVVSFSDLGLCQDLTEMLSENAKALDFGNTGLSSILQLTKSYRLELNLMSLGYFSYFATKRFS